MASNPLDRSARKTLVGWTLFALSVVLLLAALADLADAAPQAPPEMSDLEKEIREPAIEWNELRNELEAQGVPKALAGKIDSAIGRAMRENQNKMLRIAGRLERDVAHTQRRADAVYWQPWFVLALSLFALAACARAIVSLVTRRGAESQEALAKILELVETERERLIAGDRTAVGQWNRLQEWQRIAESTGRIPGASSSNPLVTDDSRKEA